MTPLKGKKAHKTRKINHNSAGKLNQSKATEINLDQTNIIPNRKILIANIKIKRKLQITWDGGTIWGRRSATPINTTTNDHF